MQILKSAITAVFLMTAVLAIPAMAETVSVPVGTWAGQALDFMLALLAATVAGVVAWLAKTIGGNFGALLLTARVDQLIVKAAAYGVAVTKGAVEGKKYDFELASPIILAAYRYIEQHGSGLILQFAGTREQIIEKIIARLPLAEDVRITPTDVVVLADQAAMVRS